MLGVLILVHEVGYFLAARLCGIAVMEFSVGMGPLIAQHQGKKGTRFSLRAIPVGGYCRFYDEGEGEEEGLNDELAYNRQKVWKRAVTIASGPLMNFVVAVVIIMIYYSCVGIPQVTSIIGTVEDGMPAQIAGIESGDAIVAINGERTQDRQRISDLIVASSYNPIDITVDRNGEEKTFTMEPMYDAESSRYRVGVIYAIVRARVGLGESIPAAIQWNSTVIKLVYDAVLGLVTKGEGAAEMTGPIGTVQVIQQTTQQGGVDTYLMNAAMISVNLGFMNLLPIPGFDGSRLLFLLFEAIARRPVKKEIEGTIYMIGFVMIMGLMLLLTFQDVARIIG